MIQFTTIIMTNRNLIDPNNFHLVLKAREIIPSNFNTHLICRSKVTVKVTRPKFWYGWKGLLIRNVHLKWVKRYCQG